MAMRLFLFAFCILVLSVASADENQKQSRDSQTIYPAYLTNLSIELKLIPEMPLDRQEYVEVSLNEYPGLEISLPDPNELLSFRKFEWKLPPPGPSYYQPGGHVLYHFGIYSPSGQLVTTSLPLTTDVKK